MKNIKINNTGSATIFMVLLLVPMIAFMCVVIFLAQLSAAKGMAADGISLAGNAIYASYNKPMRDAYGIYCYTKTPAELTEVANYHVNKSMEIDAQVNAVVVYEGESLANDELFTQQIVDYMKNWDRVAGKVTVNHVLQMKAYREKALEIREKLQADYDRAINSTYQETQTPEGDAVTARENAVSTADASLLRLDFGGANNEDKPYYANYTSLINSAVPVISYTNTSEVNVGYGISMLDCANAYLQPIDQVYASMLAKDTNYKVALYAFNNFSAYNYFGCASLTGNYFQSGDVVSISPWAEAEFILNGTDSDQKNAETVRDMIYNMLFMEYMARLYDICMSDTRVHEHAVTLSGGNPDKVELIKDEFLVGISANLAWDSLEKSYGFLENQGVTFASYPYYIELFLMLDTQRDYQGMMGRMKYLIGENMRNPASSQEAREFEFSKAYLMPSIDSYQVIVTPSFGGSVSFEGR
ncbi:MAG: hypothetical protein IJX85_04725 [Lachnospiraceae bacterium]|nr:hypothetical protein [Lachnospiraceae bacterium]